MSLHLAVTMYKDQLSLTNPHDMLHQCKHAANK